MSEYIYEYLPSLFLYQEFNDEEGEIYTVNPLKKPVQLLPKEL